MYNAEVSNNFARHNGGGIYINDGTATIGETDATENTTGRIENNRANSFAGGIYVNRESSELLLKNAFVTGNSAMTGGGVYVAGGTFEMSGTAAISNNTATTFGGGVYVGSNATFTMTGGTIGGSTTSSMKTIFRAKFKLSPRRPIKGVRGDDKNR